MKNNQREHQSSRSTSISHSADEESESNPFGTTEEEDEREPRRRSGGKQPSMVFKVEIPKFERQLNPDDLYLEKANWFMLQTVWIALDFPPL